MSHLKIKSCRHFIFLIILYWLLTSLFIQACFLKKFFKIFFSKVIFNHMFYNIHKFSPFFNRIFFQKSKKYMLNNVDISNEPYGPTIKLCYEDKFNWLFSSKSNNILSNQRQLLITYPTFYVSKIIHNNCNLIKTGLRG